MKRNTGLTLIELLVVIAIVAMLAGLLSPALLRAKGSARLTACKNQMHQIGLALQVYVQEYGNTYPYYLGPSGPAYGDTTYQGEKFKGLVYWSSKLFPYCSQNWTNELFHCPGYKGVTTGPVRSQSGPPTERFGSYAYNAYGVAKTGGFGLGPMMFWSNAAAISEGQIKVPSEMLAIGESRHLAGKVETWNGGFDTLRCGALWTGTIGFPFDPARHGSKYNALFSDGHVSPILPGVLFDPTKSAAMWNFDHQPHPELWVQ